MKRTRTSRRGVVVLTGLILVALASTGMSSVRAGTVEADGPDQQVLEVEATEAPLPEAPVTEAPVPDAPVTEAPLPGAPVTEAPVPDAPVTEAPAPDAQALAAEVPEAQALDAQGPAPKVYICKYVGKPGVDERLQTGQNPIEVSANATGGVAVGSYFADKHGRSYVLGIVPMYPEPTAADCPPPDVPESGRVEVTKVVVGEGAPDDAVFEIVLTPEGGSAISKAITGAGVVVFEDLEPGVYTLSENDPGSDWEVSYSATTITVEADQTATATITNTYDPQVVPPELGSVVVTKVVTGEPPVATYQIGLVGPAPATTERWSTVTGAGAVTFTGLPPGTYTVVEGDPGEGYTVTISPTTVIVTSGGVARATVTNAYVKQASSPPTTVPPTTVPPTTVPPTTVASAQPTTTAPSAAQGLATTGSDGRLAIVALTLVAGGVALTALTRRRVS